MGNLSGEYGENWGKSKVVQNQMGNLGTLGKTWGKTWGFPGSPKLLKISPGKQGAPGGTRLQWDFWVIRNSNAGIMIFESKNEAWSNDQERH